MERQKEAGRRESETGRQRGGFYQHYKEVL